MDTIRIILPPIDLGVVSLVHNRSYSMNLWLPRKFRLSRRLCLSWGKQTVAGLERIGKDRPQEVAPVFMKDQEDESVL